MGTSAVLSSAASAAGWERAGGLGWDVRDECLSFCLDRALPQTSPRSQGPIAVPVIKLLVHHVCNQLCGERRLAGVSHEQGRAPQSTPGVGRAGLPFPQPPWPAVVPSCPQLPWKLR